MVWDRIGRWWSSLGWKGFTSVGVVLGGLVALLYFCLVVQPKIDEAKFALTPHELPEFSPAAKREFLSQGWTPEQAHWFHHASQGTLTLPIPFRWFMALEQPDGGPLKVLLPMANELFHAPEYLARLGFIRGQTAPGASLDTEVASLPIGFATTPAQYFEGIDRSATAIGLTCAACHTAHLVHGETEYVIEGGPASTDLGLLTQTLGVALAQTALSSALPVLDGRFQRFATRVLGTDQTTNNVLTRKRLKAELNATLALLEKQQDTIDVTEGYARLDALNRIGNEVFAKDQHRPGNRVAIDAPVNYPFLWTTSWFDWVQYDGSIMQPLVRNTGEALGVSAHLNLTAPTRQPSSGASVAMAPVSIPGGPAGDREWVAAETVAHDGDEASDSAAAALPADLGVQPAAMTPVTAQANAPKAAYGQRFASSVPVVDLFRIEQQLAGEDPLVKRSFGGLQAPAWPSAMGAIDTEKARQGEVLYNDRCAGCHLPPLRSEAIWQHMRPIEYRDGEAVLKTPGSYLHLKLIPLKEIGTDPRQANVLAARTVNTTGLGLDTEVCTHPPAAPRVPGAARHAAYAGLGFVRITDSPSLSFALALGALIQEANDQWFDQHFIPPAARRVYEGARPNCLQAGAGYKARPLNGIWATAPFLHNGSVPTLEALLSPVSERPRYVQLGNPAFDAEDVGVAQDAGIAKQIAAMGAKPVPDYIDGIFILDTRMEGNRNTGHEFVGNGEGAGVLGKALSKQERAQLLEFLKTL